MPPIKKPGDIPSSVPKDVADNTERVFSKIAYDRLDLSNDIDDSWSLNIEWDANSLTRREFVDVVGTVSQAIENYDAFRAMSNRRGNWIVRVDYR